MKKSYLIIGLLFLSFLFVSCSTSTPNQLANDNTVGQTFTLEELSQYTGANGSTAYIAVNGIVYDVTEVFTNGMHQGIQIGGTDATLIFSVSPHTADLLATLPVVGTLVTSNNETTTSLPSSNTTATNPTTSSTTLPVFTLDELSQYTGANGSTAYIAVNGVIYDVTNVFTNGTHQGIQLGGTDATQAFASSPHSASLLATLPIVGSLEGYSTITSSAQTTQSSTSAYYDDEYEDEDEDEYEDEDEDEDEYEYEYEDEAEVEYETTEVNN